MGKREKEKNSKQKNWHDMGRLFHACPENVWMGTVRTDGGTRRDGNLKEMR
jgi:hypothetical protein